MSRGLRLYTGMDRLMMTKVDCQVYGKIREGILKLIALERKGDMIDRGRLRGLISMLVELGLYGPLEQVHKMR
jgi:hypothetical protein